MTLRATDFAAEGSLAVDGVSAGIESRGQEPSLNIGPQPRIAVQSWMS